MTTLDKMRLKSFVERIERMEAEKKEFEDEIRDIYAEAKGVGFDVKILRKVVALRKQDPDKRREEFEILSHYRSDLGDLADTPLGEFLRLP